MNIVLKNLLAALAASLLLFASGRAASLAPLRVLVDTGTEMPMADIRQGVMVGGIHYDVGAALAQRMGRAAVYQALPRKRIASALESGQGDVLCLYEPAWLPGHFQWSNGFFPSDEIIVSSRRAPPPRALGDLAGREIGTVHGYIYPELDLALGGDYVRADGPSSHSNLRKLALGRLQHAVTMRVVLDYRRQQGERLDVHPPLLVKQYATRCALSPRGGVDLAELNRAIARMVREGALNDILARYR